MHEEQSSAGSGPETKHFLFAEVLINCWIFDAPFLRHTAVFLIGEISGTEESHLFNDEQDRTISSKKPFMELMALASAVNQDEQRYICEGFESNKE